MKIYFFIGNMSHSGGTERVLSVIAGGLSKRGHQVAIISLWGKDKVFFPLDEKVRIFWLESKAGQHNILKQLYCLTAIVKYEKPDFLVDVDIILGFYSILVKRMDSGLHWISWEHFSSYQQFKKNNLLRKLVKKMICRFADQLIVLTEIDKRYYLDRFRLKCGITCIYNPIPYETDYQKQEEAPIVLAVGRLTEIKGFDLLIQSWKMLENQYPGWLLLIAGEGQDRTRLENIARQEGLKRLRFIGTVYPIEKLYEKAAFLVSSSKNEGFGLTLIEAMHFSLPVVCYSCESGPKEIVINEENGFLVEIGDTIGFAEKMALLMKNRKLRLEMGNIAKKSTVRFEKENILDQWEKVLGDVFLS